MNMGVGDGVDLGWKIAATLQGWGGPALIDSYEAERAPIHRKVIDEAIANFASYVAAIPPIIEEDTAEGAALRGKLGAGVQAAKGREFNTLGTVLGLGYEVRRWSRPRMPPPPRMTAKPTAPMPAPAIWRRMPGWRMAARSTICSARASPC
jgi:hypothetical protein